MEVLLMARPTLSRVIYLQQLGRGTRKAPGKECLFVFDFVDNATRYNQSLTLHRILGLKKYRPGTLVLATPELMQAEQDALARGEAPTQTLPVELWAKGYQEFDVFNWQEAVQGMVSSTDLELQLAAADGRIRSAVERGVITADHRLVLGERTYYYFRAERAEEVRQQLGLPRVDDESIRSLFLAFVNRMDMATSYKPVMLRAILAHVDKQGKARIDEIVQSFQSFYRERQERGLPVERPSAKMAKVDQLPSDDVRSVMLSMPFEKFERRRYLRYDKQDFAYIRFDGVLWRQLTPEDLASMRQVCEDAIKSYYERLPAG